MEMKEISKNPKNPYDTPEKTTNHVLNVVADMEASTLDIKEVRVSTNNDDLVHMEKRNLRWKRMIYEDSGGNKADEHVSRPCSYLGVGCYNLPAIVIPPSLPVETFAYG
ncbi:hypothetical protein TWF569_003124 [Orbilia oligospora]|uniref:Uncharacterized protein n=1 Tax=Orbilia oligospora TaxID=2813651 RepID=A0A7C8JV75_ORBOL|nr:hypothetical protein TWF706_002306 [Orbilia oligospora]KAF3087581.1 hypothetical protein TWF103_001401 [Orbilia oligospora]KAF3120503.1 hypothetical protein TWF703_002596 [Orbilia oligospora]KAF3120511.1 hypothetical protein TWF569_003124 [Orbilia oligospora]KAF3148930.1 hypothetical protein TWF594_000384 [Orbilia oligospora]